MKAIFNFFYSFIKISIITLFSTPKQKSEPVRLEKVEEKKKVNYSKIDYKSLLFIIVVVSAFIITSIIIFKTGSLESTRIYNNLSSRI